MIVKEIIKKYLRDNGYDGLCNEGCSCDIDDLVPCGEDFSYCVPGHKEKPTPENYTDYLEGDNPDYIIVPGKKGGIRNEKLCEKF